MTDSSFFSRLRNTFGSGGPDARKRGIAGFRPPPGPFDSPPSEPIELDADLPWELREDVELHDDGEKPQGNGGTGNDR